MPNFQDTFETSQRSFIRAFPICMTVPLTMPLTLFLSDQHFFSALQNIYDPRDIDQYY